MGEYVFKLSEFVAAVQAAGQIVVLDRQVSIFACDIHRASLDGGRQAGQFATRQLRT